MVLMEIDVKRSALEQKFLELCDLVTKENHLCLYDLDYFPAKHQLRLFIYNEKTKSATIDDCVVMDRALTPHIEELDWMPEELTLEVSSPGIYRRLRTRAHFELSYGEEVKIEFENKFDTKSLDEKLSKELKKAKSLTAKLEAMEEDEIYCALSEKNYKFKLKDIKRVLLEPKGVRG